MYNFKLNKTLRNALIVIVLLIGIAIKLYTYFTFS